MNLDLPVTLEVDGEEKEIYTDFRDIITIMIACNDTSLTNEDKAIVILNNLYVDDFTTFKDMNEAYKKACWFIDWGKDYSKQETNGKVMDWEQDYNLIISSVNKVIQEEVRSINYMHWWTFLGFFSERGECQYSTITEIRDKLNKGKKLESYEKEFLKENKDVILLKDKSMDEFETELFGGD